jgi:hypothetical protein
MSGCAIVLALVSPTVAGAAEAPSIAAAPPADDLDARHRIGFQAGGSSFLQFDYRLRTVSHVYLDLGLGGAPHGPLNGSVGVVIAYRTGTRFFPYAAGGAGFGVLWSMSDTSGEPSDTRCVDGTMDCPSSSRGVYYGYARAGMGMTLGATHHLSLLLDFGAWMGTKWRSRDDGMGTLIETSERFIWPMPGLAGFVSF